MNYAAFWSSFIIFWILAIIVLAVQFLHQILSPPRKCAGAPFPKLWAQQEELQTEQRCVSSSFSPWPIRSGLYLALKRLLCGVPGHGLHSLSLCLFSFYLESSKSSASFHSSRVQLPYCSVRTFPRTDGLSSVSNSPGETSVLMAPASPWLFRWEPEEPPCWAGGHGSSQ